MLYSGESEQAIIANLLVDSGPLPDVLARVSAADFFVQDNRDVMKVIEALHNEGEPVDLVTVTSRLREQSVRLGKMAADAWSSANLAAYADTVRDYSRRRALIATCHQAIQDAQSQSAGEVSSELVGAIEQASERAIGASLTFREALRAAADEIAEASESQTGGIVGVPTGIPVFDNATSGLCARRFIALAARPSLGKTALANQIAIHAASRNFPVGICSLEMGEEELGVRAMSNRYGVNFTRLLRGDTSAVEGALKGMESDPIDGFPIHLDTSTYSLVGIEARVASWVRNHGVRAAFVDHVGLVEVEGDLRTVERIGLVTRRLKKLAKRLNIAVVGVFQLNRSNEKESRRPRLSDLRDSGHIEQDIDIAVFLHADPEANGREVEIKFGFLKNRTGRRGWSDSTVVFDGSTQTFREIAQGWEDSHAA